MYPWQSGSDGREESQELHLNPSSGHWTPDETRLQRHVNSAIAYNVWKYYQTTGDTEFLSFYGAEMLLEIARFWASLATRNQELDRYEIRGWWVPTSSTPAIRTARSPGLDNHAYTNLTAVWAICRALDLPRAPAEPSAGWSSTEQLGISEDELTHWDTLSRRIRRLCFHGDGIMSQFEGFDDLKELDWEAYRRRYGDIQRLDRILEAEGDSPNHYQATKQADVLMLFYLFSAEEIERSSPASATSSTPNRSPATWSTTGPAHQSRLHPQPGCRRLGPGALDRPRSWSLFTEALESDVADIQGGTTSEGIHLGAMAGTVDLIQRCYTGIEVRDQHLWLNPSLPEELRGLRIRVRFQGQTLEVRITHRNMRIKVISPEAETVHLGVEGNLVELAPGRSITVDLRRTPLYVDRP
jgi:alpha,alpha-trehalase